MNSLEIERSVIEDVARYMCAAARTAPKARGIDNIFTFLLEGNDKEKVCVRMRKIAEGENRPFFARDAENLKNSELAVLIGAKVHPIDLDCGFCGYRSCEEMLKHNGVCAYNPLDLGIAVGSAVSIAADFRIDNRVMYTIGRTAVELGIFGEEVRMGVGIPLSITGKNPYFDRR